MKTNIKVAKALLKLAKNLTRSQIQIVDGAMKNKALWKEIEDFVETLSWENGDPSKSVVSKKARELAQKYGGKDGKESDFIESIEGYIWEEYHSLD